LVHRLTGIEIGFNLATRDVLLLYFFSAIGLNADLKTLVAGGRPLLVLVGWWSPSVAWFFRTDWGGCRQLLGLNPFTGLLGGLGVPAGLVRHRDCLGAPRCH
jgi:ESS family glutamate:Na+ symporter